ncbi:hypothetical protein PHYBLDRAFT_172883 [Phycomyces blakesleeanus NRRL 1555(-)]|uniref:Uncharacterized protein n=1 Tax=Phycomyces blakesleeanus (strain ATCC 8743b / DSM 1359 / FGSC 10004 / NBRC 33097 / NRRL 1555) TaxID=763407 RepID=A0A167KWK1_PHYB8|nr:hypothetical protein PHYBLDRAFT_172883 [Phycomyces blakesleeanus NRRL 1555(-)]OAD69049.1 hypothetical protein PHYBLDRAFT_172883 [Phycomyces blakesleeanus NRRL 1555(-)]|eukprot:XP_018287089.1 hypothetical protein PHYBLDRAFT_172883 [Phycomyces blakesleeanus NRRL 1555(-)]
MSAYKVKGRDRDRDRDRQRLGGNMDSFIFLSFLNRQSIKKGFLFQKPSYFEGFFQAAYEMNIIHLLYVFYPEMLYAKGSATVFYCEVGLCVVSAKKYPENRRQTRPSGMRDFPGRRRSRKGKRHKIQLRINDIHSLTHYYLS